jgi:hypothetical protein
MRAKLQEKAAGHDCADFKPEKAKGARHSSSNPESGNPSSWRCCCCYVGTGRDAAVFVRRE